MLNKSLLSGSQIISFNPILNADKQKKNYYGKIILNYVEQATMLTNRFWDSWRVASEEFYKNLLLDPEENSRVIFENRFNCGVLLLTDIAAILGYDSAILLSDKIDKSLMRIRKHFTDEQKFFLSSLRYALGGNVEYWSWLKKNPLYKPLGNYLSIVENNFNFMNQKPFKIFVTATMSAGKSTFINALTGKKICKSQNLACTSKIHNIISKPYEDGYISKEDPDLILNADEEILMNDNPKNLTPEITISTYFHGDLGGMRIVICDSPGVNASDHIEHKNITEEIIERNRYDLLIYVMNATQLFTEDENAHIDFVKETCEHKKVIFIVNKIDMLNPDEENIFDIIENVREYVTQKGFNVPIICPVSALAGILVKCNRRQMLNRMDERKLYNLVDKFEKMPLNEYYKKDLRYVKIKSQNSEAEQLFYNSGFFGVERIIRNLILSKER